MSTEPSLKNLAKKMINIMKEVEHIQKTGVNSFHKYKYATETDVTAAFSKAFINQSVFMFSSIVERHCYSYQTRGNKESFIVTVKLQVTFIDAESGEQFTATFFGDGSDPDDKGVYKALTGAQKYALLKTFLAATSDDPEREVESNVAAAVVDRAALISHLEAKAQQGTKILRQAWRALTAEQRNAVRHHTEILQQLALEADQTLKPEDISS